MCEDLAIENIDYYRRLLSCDDEVHVGIYKSDIFFLSCRPIKLDVTTRMMLKICFYIVIVDQIRM